jgi:Big-like domain-containing protein
MRSMLAAWTCLVVMAGCRKGSNDLAGPATALTVAAGTQQSGTAGKQLPQPLRVLVTDAKGRPVQGQLVTFHVILGGGSVFSGASISDANGIAQDRWTLGTRITEPQEVEARAVDSTGTPLVFATFTATAVADSVATVVAVGGNRQTAPPAATLLAPCQASVLDQYANPVAGAEITWTSSGGGAVSPQTSFTDATGIASTAWTLPSAEGTQTLQASAAGFSTSFTAQALEPATIGVPGGSTPRAAPGTVLNGACTVVISAASGARVGSVPVTFAVTAGGGALEFASAITDATGTASCGQWTLGPTPALNLVTVSAGGAPPAILAASAELSSPDIQLSIWTNNGGIPRVDSPVFVIVQTSVLQDITSVVVDAAGVTASLALGFLGDSIGFGWSGYLDVGATPRGLLALHAVATDRAGNQAETFWAVFLDRPPTISIAAPLPETVTRPGLDLAAVCGDDDSVGCSSLTASLDGGVLASGTSSLAQRIGLAAWDGRPADLQFDAVDSAGQHTVQTRRVYVESSAQLSDFAETAGPVWDVSGSRVLYLDPSTAPPSLRIADVDAGTIETVETNSAFGGLADQSRGFLTPRGAIFADPDCQVMESRDGGLTALASSFCSTLRVAGTWAVYADQAVSIYSARVRDLDAGTEALVTDAGDGVEVAGNGDVVFASRPGESNVFRWRAGTLQQLSFDGNTLDPITDGINVAYLKIDGGISIALHDGGTEAILSTLPFGVDLEPHRLYEVAGGFVAYTKQDVAQVPQIWRRGPDGDEPITSSVYRMEIAALAPDGVALVQEQMGNIGFILGTNDVAHRYLAVPGQPLQQIGSSLGRVVVRDGRFYVLLGRSVLQLAP